MLELEKISKTLVDNDSRNSKEFESDIKGMKDKNELKLPYGWENNDTFQKFYNYRDLIVERKHWDLIITFLSKFRMIKHEKLFVLMI